MIPNIETGAKMTGLVMYLAGPGRANEHTNPHIVAASTPSLSLVGGAGVELSHDTALELASELDAARLVFGTEVSRRDKGALAAAQERGLRGSAAIAEATKDENVWHCSLSLSPDETEALTGDGSSAQGLSDAKWQQIAEQFMAQMGFDSEGDAPARWVAIRHGMTKAGGDHIHIAASRVRDDGSVVKLWFPEPGEDRPRGDRWRAQKVCTVLEEEHGLVITTGRARSYSSTGVSAAQQNIAARIGRAEPAKATLARRVRAVAGAAESEAEFVRLARAHGLLIRPRYAATSKTEVVGYSVALPVAEYRTRDGKPVWHGGGKLGTDLTLPRLRERWSAPDAGAHADAVAAWAHDQREVLGNSAPSVPGRGAAKAAASPRPMTSDQAKAALRRTLLAAAQGSSDEVGFIRTARDKGVLLRPRYARGTSDKIVGYSAALRPQMYADSQGQPVWHGGGKLDKELSLSALRTRWPHTGIDSPMTVKAWQRVAPEAATAAAAAARTAQGSVDAARMREGARSARAWQERINTLNATEATARPGVWARAARDTASAMAAWSVKVEGDQPAELARMADALSVAAQQRRSPRPARPHAGGQLRRVAAIMLAASHDDPRYAWMAMFAQLAATSRAISDALAAQGHTARAQELSAATTAASAKFAAIAGDADAARIGRLLAADIAAPAATTGVDSGPAVRTRPAPPPGRDGHGR